MSGQHLGSKLGCFGHGYSTLRLAHVIAWARRSASLAAAVAIQKDGFTPSAEGELGPGVYLVDVGNIDKAKRFAHDTFHRVRGSRNASSANEPALIECMLFAKVTTKINGIDKGGSWIEKGYDACYTDQTGLSKSSEWCVADPTLIVVSRIIDLRGVGCPWGGHCPYTTKNVKAASSPWGGLCPCDPNTPLKVAAQPPAVYGQESICKTLGCGKPSWNGQPGGFCSRRCRDEASAATAPTTDGGDPDVLKLVKLLPPTCDLHGCGKPTWNGQPNGYCSKRCQAEAKAVPAKLVPLPSLMRVASVGSSGAKSDPGDSPRILKIRPFSASSDPGISRPRRGSSDDADDESEDSLGDAEDSPDDAEDESETGA